MRIVRKVVIAGFATLGLAGTAMAASHELHTMNVNLPDGSVARISYAGNVAPQVVVQPVAATGDAAWAGALPDPVIAASFADLDRMSAMMDAQDRAMMQQVAAMQQAAAQQIAGTQAAVASGKAPASGSWSYTVMTSSNGKDACTQSVSWSSDGTNAQPKVQRTSAGNCDTVQHNAAPVPASETKAATPVPLARGPAA